MIERHEKPGDEAHLHQMLLTPAADTRYFVSTRAAQRKTHHLCLKQSREHGYIKAGPPSTRHRPTSATKTDGHNLGAMKTLLFVLVLAVAVAQAKAHGRGRSGDWGYGNENGPDTWPDHFPTCGGSRQSPVAINTGEAETDIPHTSFHFVNYDAKPTTVTLTNTGHSVQVNMDINASVSGGSLTGEFVFHQFHFHWGAVYTRGSEHTVDHNRFPGELHLVHYRESYGSWAEAVKHEDGVAVFSVLLELHLTDNPNLHPIVNGLMDVILPHETALISSVALHSLLPSNVDHFFRYSGSLTTPGCDEVVEWTIFRDRIHISSSQLKQFRELTAEDGSTLQDNFRTLQPLNEREVYRSWL
ncbi:hypothetical protein O3P69_006339 [Scylla paramamosain]|uniref:Carbonic anhydrase n=1 Tax=Scylla paramamosain TaxID=85552 RepID=A0AAW0U6Q5_SCYPA